jgi:flagellar biosynthesis GTPase FlhF
MGYAIMVGPGGIGKTKAIDRLAEQFDCSVTTVKTAIRKYGAEAVGIVGGPTGKLKQE